MLQNTEKYENCHEKSTSVLGPDAVEHRKGTRITTKDKHRRIWPAKKAKKVRVLFWKNSVQEHPRTPKSTRITTKNEQVRELPRETRFWPFQEHRRTPKSTSITTQNEHRRSWRAGNYEDSHAKPVDAHPSQAETTKIHIQNEHASTKPRK